MSHERDGTTKTTDPFRLQGATIKDALASSEVQKSGFKNGELDKSLLPTKWKGPHVSIALLNPVSSPGDRKPSGLTP